MQVNPGQFLLNHARQLSCAAFRQVALQNLAEAEKRRADFAAQEAKEYEAYHADDSGFVTTRPRSGGVQ